LEAVLIHVHRARLSPRVIPGPSQFVALFLRNKSAIETESVFAHADEKLTAFLELERVTREAFRFLNAE
jgi:hypothetical protein